MSKIVIPTKDVENQSGRMDSIISILVIGGARMKEDAVARRKANVNEIRRLPRKLAGRKFILDCKLVDKNMLLPLK